MRKLVLSLVMAALAVVAVSSVAMAADGSGTASDRLDVKGTDIVSSGQGTWVRSWAQQTVDRWEQAYGWHMPQTTTIYLYGYGAPMAKAYATFSGTTLSTTQMNDIANRGAISVTDKSQAGRGGVVILVNLGSGWFGAGIGKGNWQNEVKGAIVKELAAEMLNDVAGSGGPTWARIGFINYLAWSEVPWLNEVSVQTNSFRSIMNNPTTPGLVALHNNWNGTISMSPVVYNTSLLIANKTVQYIVNKWGPMALINMLKQTSQGGTFETLFQSATGMTIQQMDMTFRQVP